MNESLFTALSGKKSREREGALEYWKTRMLEDWNSGMLEYWGLNPLFH